MKIFLSFFLILITCRNIQAQNKTKELYIGFSNFSLSNAQIKYKFQIGKRLFFKTGLINLTGYSNSTNYSGTNNYPTTRAGHSEGIELGLEWRKAINKNVSFFHGINASYTYSDDAKTVKNPVFNSREQTDHTIIHQINIPYTIGLLWELAPHILMAIEINPSISYSNTTYKFGYDPFGKNRSLDLYNLNLNNRVGLLSVAYRF